MRKVLNNAELTTMGKMLYQRVGIIRTRKIIKRKLDNIHLCDADMCPLCVATFFNCKLCPYEKMVKIHDPYMCSCMVIASNYSSNSAYNKSRTTMYSKMLDIVNNGYKQWPRHA